MSYTVDMSNTWKRANDGQYCYAYCQELRDVFNLLSEGDYDLNEWERNFINSIHKYAQSMGYLTYRQMRVLGGISKTHIQDGVYVHHNWWNGTIKKIRFHEDHTAVVAAICKVADDKIIKNLTASEFRLRFEKKLTEPKKKTC